MSQQIDVDNILADKKPRLAKWLPKFIKTYIKRVIHQNEINYCLTTYSDKQGVDFVRATLNWMKITTTVKGGENLSPQGRYIFASNHPLGGLDGLILADEINKLMGDTKLIVNDILMNLTPVNSLFVPVNKHGKQFADYARTMNELYNSPSQIISFPAGLCSRKIKGRIEDLCWKKNFLVKAIEHKRDIVPVYVNARNSNFFYNLANFRKFWRIGANIEMFYLPREMFRCRGKNIEIIIGKPISYQHFTKERNLQDWTKYIRNIVYSLK